MKPKRAPNSLRKHIRKEKARIRREVLDFKKQEELIKELYLKFSPVGPKKIEYKTEKKKPTQTASKNEAGKKKIQTVKKLKKQEKPKKKGEKQKDKKDKKSIKKDEDK